MMEESLYQSRNFAQSFHCTSQYFHDGLCLHGTMVLQGGKKLAVWEIIVSYRLDSMLNSCYCLAKLWPYYCLNCTGAISCTHNTIMAHIPISIQLSSCYTVPIFFCLLLYSYYKYLSPLHHVAQSLHAVIFLSHSDLQCIFLLCICC